MFLFRGRFPSESFPSPFRRLNSVTKVLLRKTNRALVLRQGKVILWLFSGHANDGATGDKQKGAQPLVQAGP